MVEIAGIIFGFILGILSSWIFWRWQLMVKPEFCVSTKIAMSPSPADSTKRVCRIKIVNKSSRFIIGLIAKCSIQEINLSNVGPGRINRSTINLVPGNEEIIGPRRKNFNPWEVNNVQYYRFEFDDDLEQILRQDNRRIVFTVQATDAQSSTTIIRRITYIWEDFIWGSFGPQRDLKIIPLENKPPLQE